MPFEPFGYPFELKSPLRPSAVKAAIRSRKKSWFDPRNGARGWIVGPFICLWSSALDLNRSMLMGRISGDDNGARIVGRAGSDLTSVLLSSVFFVIAPVIIFQMIWNGDFSFKKLIIILTCFAPVSIILWFGHKYRKEAAPLVGFIKSSILTDTNSSIMEKYDIVTSKYLTLNIGGYRSEYPITSGSILDALMEIYSGGFLILESGPETYIQTAPCDGGYILEKRDGDSQRHFHAVRSAAVPFASGSSCAVFTFEEVLEALISYASDTPMPLFMNWESMTLAD